MAGDFKDHFSDASGDYKQYRPGYPDTLFSYLASISPQTHVAWDCATGSGQAAVSLSGHFAKVIATDASATQIEGARPGRNIRYRVASAENSGITDNSIDLITVAQALHWFDIDAFTEEASRVLKQGGAIAVWTYNRLSVQASIDQRINYLYGTVLDEYWPKERRMVENSYRDITLPFDEVKTPDFQMTAQWDLAQLLGYLGTWSAAGRYQKEHGTCPLETVSAALSESWGDATARRKINWPLSLRVWRK